MKRVGSLNIFEYYTFLRMLLLRAGDIELNPGPRSDSDSLLSEIPNETSDIIRNNFSIVHHYINRCKFQMVLKHESGYAM